MFNIQIYSLTAHLCICSKARHSFLSSSVVVSLVCFKVRVFRFVVVGYVVNINMQSFVSKIILP